MCCVRGNFRFCESLRFRISVGVENRCRHGGVARPETKAAHLLGVSLARDRIGQMRHPARMRRRGPTGETSDREIKTAPEKMHGTALSAEPRAEFLKHAIAFHENV